MQDHEARASDLNRKLIFSFVLLFSYSKLLKHNKHIKAFSLKLKLLKHRHFLTSVWLWFQFSLIVRLHNSKFQAKCALFDTSIKFDTLIAVTNTTIFRYSAKSDVHWFPWKQQFFFKSINFLCSYPSLSENTLISMLPIYLPSSIWRVAFNYVFPWKRKLKIPHLFKTKESSASCEWASSWLDHCLQ